jgi:hypothetical protein
VFYGIYDTHVFLNYMFIPTCFNNVDCFTFSVPCNIIPLLQFQQTNAHKFINIAVILYKHQHWGTTLCTLHVLHIEEFSTVLLRAVKETVKQLFCTVVCSPMLDQWGLKHVDVGVGSKELLRYQVQSRLA